MPPSPTRDGIAILVLILAAAAAAAACDRKPETEVRKEPARPRKPFPVVPALGVRG